MKKTAKHKYPLVRVVWRDSNMYRFQDSIEYALGNYSVESIVTIGFLLGYNKKDPVVAREIMNRGADQRCSIVIPKENILSFTKIKGNYSDHWEWAEKRMPANTEKPTVLPKKLKQTKEKPG